MEVLMKIFKNNQSGRSMVEMLGVLAIIGVLSVGAIAGYSKAMMKYKMNKTLDIISHATNRVAELSTMKLGRSLNTTQDMIDYGIISNCDSIEYSSGYTYCALPLGGFNLNLTPSSSSGLYARLDIVFDKEPVNSCIAFLTSRIYKELGNVEGIFVSTEDGAEEYHLYDPSCNDFGDEGCGFSSGQPTNYGDYSKNNIDSISNDDIAKACNSARDIVTRIRIGWRP